MNTADSLASGALGAVVVALGWLISHSAQIRRVLDLLPTIAADAAKAQAAVEQGGGVVAQLDDEAKALLRRVVTALEGHPAAATAPDPAAPTTGPTV